jgi:uncharacterized membrane protein
MGVLLVIGVLVMLGGIAAMDRTTGALRRKVAWASTGAAVLVVSMLLVAPPDVWIRQ